MHEISYQNALLYSRANIINYKQKKENLVLPLDKVVRKATDEDLKQYDENFKNAEKALAEAKKISKDLNLDMNFLDAFYNLDN